MAKQKLPTEEQLNKYNKLCSLAFSRRVGAPINVKLDAFEICGHIKHITKSKVFGANISIVSPDSVGTVEVPSKVIIKEYISGNIGTSEDKDISDYEFRKERAILDQEIHIIKGGEIIRVYPLLYSRDVPECEREKIIIREYIPGENLEQIAEKQKKEGKKIKWESVIGTPAISDSLYPIALFQVQSPALSSILKERNLLRFGTPEEAKSYEIAEDRAERFIRYIQKLTLGMGTPLNDMHSEKLRDEYFELDRKHISRKNLLSLIDGELDVFPHHAMLKRLPDAGGVEIGGFVRDLALYSAPVFESLWDKPEKMVKDVKETYLNIRKQFETSLLYPSTEFDNETLDLGILLASFNGNIRASAAIVHYNGRDEGYPVEKEASLYLQNSFKYLNSFIKNSYQKEDIIRAKTIRDILEQYNLNTNKYKLADSFLNKNPIDQRQGAYA